MALEQCGWAACVITSYSIHYTKLYDDGPASFPNAHFFHVNSRGQACGRCHDGYTTTSVNKSYHVDGVRDVVVVPTGGGTQRINGWDCSACHSALGV